MNHGGGTFDVEVALVVQRHQVTLGGRLLVGVPVGEQARQVLIHQCGLGVLQRRVVRPLAQALQTHAYARRTDKIKTTERERERERERETA